MLDVRRARHRAGPRPARTRHVDCLLRPSEQPRSRRHCSGALHRPRRPKGCIVSDFLLGGIVFLAVFIAGIYVGERIQ
jgi:hypothetical protein